LVSTARNAAAFDFTRMVAVRACSRQSSTTKRRPLDTKPSPEVPGAKRSGTSELSSSCGTMRSASPRVMVAALTAKRVTLGLASNA
jgi:hypothetical protein